MYSKRNTHITAARDSCDAILWVARVQGETPAFLEEARLDDTVSNQRGRSAVFSWADTSHL